MKKSLNIAELLSFLQHYAKRRKPFEEVFSILNRDYTIPQAPEVKPLLAREYDIFLEYKQEVKNKYNAL